MKTNALFALFMCLAMVLTLAACDGGTAGAPDAAETEKAADTQYVQPEAEPKVEPEVEPIVEPEAEPLAEPDNADDTDTPEARADDALPGMWSKADWTGGASEDYLGVWKDDSADEWPYLYVYSDKIRFGSESGMMMNVSPYFVCGEDMAELDLEGGWLGFGGERDHTTKTMLLLTEDDTLKVENVDGYLGFSSFPLGEYRLLEPFDLRLADSIDDIIGSDEELDNYGNPLFRYQETNVTYEWTTDDQLFAMFGSFVNDFCEDAGRSVFREISLSGQKGVFSSFSVDGVSRLDVLESMGAISADGHMTHESIQLLHVQSAAAIQFIILSRDSDGVTYIAALTYDKDADAYEWNEETYMTRGKCAVSLYGRFCYVDDGFVMTTAQP